MTTAFLAWRAPTSRRWYTVGRLLAGDVALGSRRDAGAADGAPAYEFAYTGGAEEARRDAGFEPLASFPDFRTRYRSGSLFAFFANRLLPRSRPEYRDYVEWLSVGMGPNDPIALLARSGGRRQTDEFELYPRPVRDVTGTLRLHCFVHGIRYFAGAEDRLATLSVGDPLLLAHDFQNPTDPHAIVVRTPGDTPGTAYAVGFLPRYVAREVCALRDAMGAAPAGADLRATVERVNPPAAPLWFRLLCRVVAPWPAGYDPFVDAAHQPLPTSRAIQVGAAAPLPAAV